MSSVTLSELHSDTAGVVKRVSEGETIFIEQDGETVAQLRPIAKLRPTTPMPDREAYFRTLKPDPTEADPFSQQLAAGRPFRQIVSTHGNVDLDH
jgi:antitoxin (DNA-binding transcriptional repressor) of toxin-antitoxin stability system